MATRGRRAAVAATGLVLLATAAAGPCNRNGGSPPNPPAPQGPPITITYQRPTNLTNTSLAGAAAFAWQEFIALNWPAAQQTGQPNTRGAPEVNWKFGAVTDRPLVWHTYRSKIEIFPPQNMQPNGYSANAAVSYGYDSLPRYNYIKPVTRVPNTPVYPATPWINLDENDEIGLDAMYAGVASGVAPLNGLILFTAKANRQEYNYVAANGFFDGNKAGPAIAASRAFVAQNRRSPPPGSSQMASLPDSTIEIKAAWRQLTSTEASSGRFYTTRVRYYPDSTTYADTVMGLVGLHIIQKTPGQPYFVFATFEQADNILTPNGQRVEDENGQLNQGFSTLPPMDAVLTPPRAAQNPAPGGYSRQNIQQFGVTSTPGSRLFYVNSPGPELQGIISVNRRVHAIPPTIIAANQQAHAAMKAYADTNRIPVAVWQYYKLVNVQYAPINKPAGMPYTGPDTATYYQANVVVETDQNLQTFSGRFQPPFADTVNTTHLITDWCGRNSKNPNVAGCPSPPQDSAFYNVYANGQRYNMGGCMGCHGNAQVQGGDFSFLLLGAGLARLPEPANAVQAPLNTQKFLQLFEAARGAPVGPGRGP